MTGTPAFAEGFLCTLKAEADLNFFVEHFRKPNHGTRRAKALYVYRSWIDEESGKSEKDLVAYFSDKLKTLKNQSTSYHARVNLKLDETGAPGAYLLGTRLQFIDYISLAVQFHYNKPVPHMTQLPGLLYVMKRNGQSQTYEANCLRFLHGASDSDPGDEFSADSFDFFDAGI